MPLDTPIGNTSVDFTRARGLTPEVEKAIEDAFESRPLAGIQFTQVAAIRTALGDAVKAIVANAPPGPDRSAAIRKCREARMDANSAIAHGGKY